MFSIFSRKKDPTLAPPPSVSLGARLRTLFTTPSLDEEQLKEFERLMLLSDAGVVATTEIMNDLKSNKLEDATPIDKLKESIAKRLQSLHAPFAIDHSCKPYVILMIGVNGSGKTTGIAKLSKRLKAQGESVMIAAGDTFRAAAVQQLRVWGERNQIPVIAQEGKADSASVIFDGIQAARARQASVLLADTAGRMHTRGVLMEELKKIVRVMGKLDSRAPHEILLVVDGTSGQNVRRQVEEFKAEFRLSGIFISKLDGSAKGGVVLSLAKYQVPVRFLGVGESTEDIMVFEPQTYTERILDIS